ncbi:4'-phosphopantetheinyl transferase superfamily [Aspergillus californicus]
MKPLRFPLPINIGTDIVHIPRIARLICRPTYLPRFTRRILSNSEQQDFQTRFSIPSSLLELSPRPSPPQPKKHAAIGPLRITPDMSRWLAGRFAAKEAARKAAPGGAESIGWKDVVVRVGDGDGIGESGAMGRPEIVFLDPNREEGDGEGEGRLGQLSISHDGDYVVATVLAWHAYPKPKTMTRRRSHGWR